MNKVKRKRDLKNGIMNKVTYARELKKCGEFKFYCAGTSFSNVSVAAHESLDADGNVDDSKYYLIAYEDNINRATYKVLGSREISKKAYENLDYDHHHSLTRFFEAAKVCGVFIN